MTGKVAQRRAGGGGCPQEEGHLRASWWDAWAQGTVNAAAAFESWRREVLGVNEIRGWGWGPR